MYHDRYCTRKSWLGTSEKKSGKRPFAIDPGAEELRTRQVAVQKGNGQFTSRSVNSASGCFTPDAFFNADRRSHHRHRDLSEGKKKPKKKEKAKVSHQKKKSEKKSNEKLVKIPSKKIVKKKQKKNQLVPVVDYHHG